MRRTIIVFTAAVLLAGPAMANGLFDGWVSPGVQGTWSTAAGCAYLRDGKDKSKHPAGDYESYTYLRDSGIEGYESSCSFVHRDQDPYGNIVAMASCTDEGDGWPDLFLLERDYKGGWRVTTKGGRDGTDVTLYPMRCDALPR